MCGSTFDGAGYVALLSDLKDAFTNANPWGGSWGLSCESIFLSTIATEWTSTDQESHGTNFLLVSAMVQNWGHDAICQLGESYDLRFVCMSSYSLFDLADDSCRHGSWDSPSDDIGSFVYAHTNLTEIEDALNLLWRNAVPANQVNLGLGFYGRFVH